MLTVFRLLASSFNALAASEFCLNVDIDIVLHDGKDVFCSSLLAREKDAPSGVRLVASLIMIWMIF